MSAKRLAVLVSKILVLAVILMLINGLASGVLPATAGAGEPAEAAAVPAPPSGSFIAIVFAVMLAQTVALAYPIVRSKWHGWRLSLAIFTLYFGTVTFMSQLESLVYLGGKMPEGMQSGLFVMGAVAAVLFAPGAVLVLGKWKKEADASIEHRQPASPGEWTWKIAVLGLVFLSLYYLFGYFVAWQIPAVRDYYGGTDPGSFIAQMKNVVVGQPWMVPYQYLRGLLWAGLAVLVIRMMKGRWWEGGLAASILFAVPSLYLLLPNEMMPEPVRMAHLIETLPYQFLFGWIAAWLVCHHRAYRIEEEAE